MNKAQTGMVVAFLLVLLIALSAFEQGGAGAFVDDTGRGAVAVMWLERHEMTMRPGEREAVLDGSKIEGEPLLVHQGRSYVAIKMVERTAAGHVYWDEARRQAVIEMKDSIKGSLGRLQYEAGTPYPYLEDGTPLTELRMPPPFVYEGQMYIPVSVLPAQGIAADWMDGAVTWRWSDKRIKLAADTVVVESQDYALTVLYQQELMTPQLMLAGGGGSWSGLEGQVLERGIIQGNRRFNQIAFRTKLQPGPNPIELRSASTGGQTLEVYWDASVNQKTDIPVKLYAEGSERVEITMPHSGYSRIQVGESLRVEGRVRSSDSAEGEVTLAVYRFNRDAYEYNERVQDVVVPVVDGMFAGEVELDASGDYLIQVISPRYLELPGQPEKGVALWAELRVAVD